MSVLQGKIPFRTAQFKHFPKPLARKRLGTRWAKYLFSRCRWIADRDHLGSRGIIGVIGGCKGSWGHYRGRFCSISAGRQKDYGSNLIPHRPGAPEGPNNNDDDNDDDDDNTITTTNNSNDTNAISTTTTNNNNTNNTNNNRARGRAPARTRRGPCSASPLGKLYVVTFSHRLVCCIIIFNDVT